MANERIDILAQKCVGCGLCESACPFGAISIREHKAVIDYERCTLCGVCAPVCRKFGAIRFISEHTQVETGRGDVWVFCEQDPGGELAHVTRELLAIARRLADNLGVGVGAVLITAATGISAEQALAFGADTVFTAEHEALGCFDDQLWAGILARAIRQHHPEILLGGATAIGRALLPRAAIDVGTGLTADCTELEIDPGTGLLLQTRPAFGGNILATITCEQRRPQMATVRPGVLPCGGPAPERPGRVVRLEVGDNDLVPSLEWLGFRPKARGGLELRQAEIIVTAGQGCGGREGVELAAALADALGGCLGASRAAVDAGWVEYAHQVGQTGTTVQPRLYIACGVSGAIQHIVGMQNSERIVAINRDPDAPIFGYADVGIVGDLHEVIPELIQTLNAPA